jgi:hypothetical protein
MMKRLLVLTGAAGILNCMVSLAAPVDEHVRGTIVSVSPDTLIVHTESAGDVSVSLIGGTHYLQVVQSSLDKIEPGDYIGTPTKEIGSSQIALAVMIFPAAMQGANAGHFDYDRLPDTTLSGGATTASKMTNGNVSAVTARQGAMANTKMTNGNVSASTSGNGVKRLTVTYQGGQQTVVVPPTAPVVNLVPGTISDLSKGAYVFVDAARDGSALTAGLVAAGVGGLKPAF